MMQNPKFWFVSFFTCSEHLQSEKNNRSNFNDRRSSFLNDSALPCNSSISVVFHFWRRFSEKCPCPFASVACNGFFLRNIEEIFYRKGKWWMHLEPLKEELQSKIIARMSFDVQATFLSAMHWSEERQPSHLWYILIYSLVQSCVNAWACSPIYICCRGQSPRCKSRKRRRAKEVRFVVADCPWMSSLSMTVITIVLKTWM